MVVQQSKKYYQIESQEGVNIIWGDSSFMDKYPWKELPHSYGHNGEILFVNSNDKNLQCDFEVENNTKNISTIAEKLKINTIKDFYRIWVIAETIAKIKDIPILQIIKSNIVESLKARNEVEFVLENIKIKYFNINKYHFAIGYKNKS